MANDVIHHQTDYAMDFCCGFISNHNPLNIVDEKGKFDELIEEKGVKILIDPKALMHVIGTKMDFVDDKLRSEFIFINPNSKGQCGCGESFMTTASKGAEKNQILDLGFVDWKLMS
uniref:Core domain-containing protein n=1 Tax=Solanum lycopersicum TaxID=4081 RepID=A0A3Q7HWZ1_SOLLC